MIRLRPFSNFGGLVTTTLLAVDDSKTMRRVLEITFAGEAYKVALAENADDAMGKLQAERPNVVLVDAGLEGTNGYELCQRIKAAQPGVPVMILSSKHQPYDRNRGSQVGVDDFMDKPFDTQQMLDKVAALAKKGASAPMHVSATLGMSRTLSIVLPICADSSPWPQEPSLCWPWARYFSPVFTVSVNSLGLTGMADATFAGAGAGSCWADAKPAQINSEPAIANATQGDSVEMRLHALNDPSDRTHRALWLELHRRAREYPLIHKGQRLVTVGVG